jgi:predicted ester cyclase
MRKYAGRAAIGQGVQRGFDVFSSLKLASTRVLVKGDVVVHEWSMTGVHSAEFHGVKPTEKPVGLSGVSLLVFDAESGLIKEERRYADTPTLLSQVGASKAKARPIPILSSSPEWRTSRGSSDEDKNAAAFTRMMAAVGEKNEASYLAAQTDDVAYDDMTQSVTMRGQSEAKKWFNGFVATFPDVKADIAGMWAVDDYVVAEITITGTHKVSKKSVTVHGLDVVQMKDGKVAHGCGAKAMAPEAVDGCVESAIVVERTGARQWACPSIRLRVFFDQHGPQNNPRHILYRL